jgi:hypothetical protein
MRSRAVLAALALMLALALVLLRSLPDGDVRRTSSQAGTEPGSAAHVDVAASAPPPRSRDRRGSLPVPKLIAAGTDPSIHGAAPGSPGDGGARGSDAGPEDRAQAYERVARERVSAAMAQVKACFDQRSAGEQMPPAIIAKLEIRADQDAGRVNSVSLLALDGGDAGARELDLPQAKTCVAGALASTLLPRPDTGHAELGLPFAFDRAPTP